MSYILEALRKVEQQREHLPAHGLSSRRRYYSAFDARRWSRPWWLVIAVIAGASVSGSVVAYLTADGEQPPPPQASPQAGQTQQAVPAAPVTAKPSSSPAETSRPLQSVSAAPLRLPGPRYEPQNKTTVPQNTTPGQPQNRPVSQPQSKAVTPPGGKTVTTQNEQAQEATPVPAPAEETAPATQPPAPPAEEKATAVASVHPPASAIARHPAATPKGAIAKRAPTSGDPLDRIAPPMAVEVQPFRPNDVVRPPSARKGTDATPGPASGEAPMLSTLPSQFQSMVPKMAINAQVYSQQPQQRFVVINMKRYNEGQSTAEGVNVVSIRQQDIVFSYQGQRFRLGR